MCTEEAELCETSLASRGSPAAEATRMQHTAGEERSRLSLCHLCHVVGRGAFTREWGHLSGL